MNYEAAIIDAPSKRAYFRISIKVSRFRKSVAEK